MLLEKILKVKHEELDFQKRQRRLEEVRAKAQDLAPTKDFLGALKQDGIRIIAEMKKASPSAGVIVQDYDPVKIAEAYTEGGAAALSVLTDQTFFRGSLRDLEKVKAVTPLPILRKDFIFDPYQVYEARAAGADAALLIAQILGKNQIVDLLGLTEELGMVGLVEIHSEEEWNHVASIQPRCVGINHRDLDSLKVDLSLSEKLIGRLPKKAVKVAESGLQSREDIDRFRQLGFHAFLIGEALLKENHPGQSLRRLLQ